MENGIVNVSTRLDPEQYDIHVCCLRKRGGFAELMPHPDQVISLDKPSGFSMAAVKSLKKQISEIKPHILHTHNLGPLIYGALASSFGGRVALIHGEHGQLDRHHLTKKRLWQRKLLYLACKRVHTVSESLRLDLIARGFSEGKITSVTNGVDIDRFQPPENKKSARRYLGLPVNGKLLGMVGRFSEFKGHMLLLDSFEQMCEMGIDIHLVLLGSGGSEEAKVLSRVNSSPFSYRIHPVGHQPRPEDFYQALDLMVFPSTHEGLSNAVLESMACGVPVLASEACGNDEAIIDGENGFLEVFDSVEGLSSAVRRIITDTSALGSAGNKARLHMMGSFSIDFMVRGYRQLYLL
ncbi:MAG: glycosyltransferase [Verrucomicrobiales bacterium]|nr:glycosyltransferase [Verrucomicrobiales bacterium]